MLILDELGGSELADLLSGEWLETNGIGGYASGSLAGAATRRYHALLVAALSPPVGRRALLAKVEERLRWPGGALELGCALYEGAVSPQGYRLLTRFRLDPWPVFTYQAGPFLLEKHVLMRHGHNATLIGYRLLEGPGPCSLGARLFIAGRDHHHLQTARAEADTRVRITDQRLEMQLHGEGSALSVRYPRGEFWADGIWYYRLLYPRERERGLDSCEDLYSPGEVIWRLAPRAEVWLVASSEPLDDTDPAIWAQRERERREALSKSSAGDAAERRQLLAAADQFIVRRGESAASVIAGYPWFTDWGRDTMIALPGLMLAPGRLETARRVLSGYAAAMSDGLIPNTFGDGSGQPAYNTVDATLWMFQALWRYLEAGGDADWVCAELYEPLCECIGWHRAGTRFDIRTTDDGLLSAGTPGTQLTWMDAKMGDCVFTPRHGKAVEIQGLWYNALRMMESLSRRFGQAGRAAQFGALADAAARAFAEQFWAEDLGYCYDCIRPDLRDPSMRPNQVIALSLRFPLLSDEQARSVLERVEATLLTPYGLRTLAPGSPGYRGRYEGDQWSRDSAYHQGTVWPWLVGPYLRLLYRVRGRTEQVRAAALAYFRPLLDDLAAYGLGSVAEVYHGDPPHRPGGCIAQAWSVAAVLELLEPVGEGVDAQPACTPATDPGPW